MIAYEPEYDDRIEVRADELLREWDQDAAKLQEAAEDVLGFSDCHVALDIASAMIGHVDDQPLRDARFMAHLRQRIAQRLKEMATEQAEKESQRWIPFHEAERQRARRVA